MNATATVTTELERTPQAARARLEAVRAQLADLDAAVTAMWRAGDAETLGYGRGAKGWAALCADLFADVQMLRPTPAARLERTLALLREGMSQRAAADALGVSAAAVNADARKLAERGEQLPDNVVGLDGVRRRREQSRPQPATPAQEQPPALELPDGLTELMRLALLAVVDAGEAGLTCLELEQVAGWRHGRASSLLHRLERRGLVRRDGRIRRLEDGSGHGIYLATLHSL